MNSPRARHGIRIKTAIPNKPSARLVATCGFLAAAAMAVGVYFGGTGRTPLAMVGTVIFVLLGGLTFELARRRSV